MSRLHNLYIDRALEGSLSLETFIDQILQGFFGPVSAEEVYSFLDEVEDEMLHNIQVKAQELPVYATSQSEAEARAREQIERLRERVRRWLDGNHVSH